jgi:hypothetical protein|uniref:DUF2846 domain-containing protein n=1 Tax=Meiothermus ruber TaxID=277 RepID=A0A7C3I2D7_MEIRU
MLRILLLLVALALLVNAKAENYEVTVTRKARNLYKVVGENIIIQTLYCYEYAYAESAILRLRGFSSTIIFLDSGRKCDVKGVYASSEQKPGRYAVTIFREENDWYQIWGTNIYIKTTGCLSLAFGQEAVLHVSAGGYGTLYVGRDQCMVEGLYSKMRY